MRRARGVVATVGVDGGRAQLGVNETQFAMREMHFQLDWQREHKYVVRPAL